MPEESTKHKWENFAWSAFPRFCTLMSRSMTKPTIWTVRSATELTKSAVRPAKPQISLGIQCFFMWTTKSRLIWGFAGRTADFVGFVEFKYIIMHNQLIIGHVNSKVSRHCALQALPMSRAHTAHVVFSNQLQTDNIFWVSILIIIRINYGLLIFTKLFRVLITPRSNGNII